MKELKPCKLCQNKRFGNLSICLVHYREREKKKREEKAKKKLERKKSSKKYQIGELKKWHKKTWTLMSEWVRRKDADWRGYGTCFTCDQIFPWKKLQAGHRHHRRLDFDERNVHVQCWTCNGKQSMGGKSGNLGEYERRLRNLHGHEWCEKLRLDANTHRGYSLSETMMVYLELKEKLIKLEKQNR